MRDKVQALAGGMMVSIIVLVIAGIFIGVGAGVVNQMSATDSVIWAFFKLMLDLGLMVMRNLPPFFAIGLAFALAKSEKGWAAFTGFTMFMCFNVAIGSIAAFHGWTQETTSVASLMNDAGYDKVAAQNFNSLWGESLGIFAYNMGIFSGILVGCITAWIHNRYYKFEMPALLSFFSGPRAVVIFAYFAIMPIALFVYYAWPPIAGALQSITTLITSSGIFGSFLFGVFDKGLLPFGLHHLIAFPIEYTRVGGVMEIDGVVYEGVRNIMNGQMSSPETTSYITHNFTSGRIPIQIGGLTGAAYAMYVTAKTANRKKVAAIMVPAVFTAAVIGITEPLEYTFLFVQPFLFFAVHVPLNGLAYVITEMMGVSIHGNQLLFMVPNLLQPEKVHAWALLWIIPLYFAIYFYTFKFFILKFDSKTPGREDEDGDIALYSKEDFKKKKEQTSKGLPVEIIEALGGADNIENVTNCATRLRVSLHDESLAASDKVWKQQLNAIGVVRMNKGIQVIYGANVITIASGIKEALGIDS
ncbi:PTS transporter subunit EIIC [Vibrio syngnathi]|uniref:PTS system maltose-and glucose-specific EIICB component n=1 Tax=Vibrio syngnathi TaxID=3034029 RepID=A0AA34XPE8_9VIBR|nr:PTS transporter subunit EIIC [Vibrio syngnathi]ARP39507.1 PTS system maltose- and glucose-specific EIICB component [Vibrio syngnathi]